jgi:signal transduction histidine kinase
MGFTKKPQTKSIQRFFLWIFIPIVLLVSAASSVLMAWSDYETNRSSRIESQKLIFETFTTMIRQPLVQGSFIEARIRADELANNPQIACIEIASNSETIKSCNKSNKGSSGLFEMTTNLYFSEDKSNLMGHLSITFDNSDLIAGIWKNTGKNAFGFIMLASILFASLSVGFSRIKKDLRGLMKILEIQDATENAAFNFEITEFSSLAKHLKYQHDISKSAAEAKAALEVARHVAHDIRSPIVSLQVALNATQASLDPKIKGVLNHSAQRISDIADDVINQHSYSNKIGVDSSIQKIPMSVSLALSEMISEKIMMCKTIPNLKLNLKLEVGDALVEMRISDFKRVISNLIDNSIQAVSENGIINVNLSAVNTECCISITDNGVGIPESILKVILESGGTYKKSKGKGLGLQWAKKTIEKNGGRFLMTSFEGKGTEIKLFLPTVTNQISETQKEHQFSLVEKLA